MTETDSVVVFLQGISRVECALAGSGLALNHVSIMRVLQDNEPLSNKEIADRAGLSAPTVSRCMSKLAALRMVRASLDDRDLRRNLFRLEARARSVLFELKRTANVDLDVVIGGYARVCRVIQHEKSQNKETAASSASCKSATFSLSAASSPLSMPSGGRLSVGLSMGACRVLLALGCTQTCTVGDVCAVAGLGQSSVSMALRQLCAARLARAVPLSRQAGQKCDARQRLYALSSVGKQAFDVVKRAIEP
ncbi:helix-turn-helix domain-containing protein [Adlercreutzia sp. ZJ138]|uniref:MarR family transcriptional regulator n=1 Tax=Adlercreutzia sp. ZJ138 TaxID=2709405 RepID=UPI0013EE3C65|nr:helix-turn-helix domain-containing protein [Adlercreutzia sp. ZJ138]